MKTCSSTKITALAAFLIMFSATSAFAQDMFDTRIDYAVGDGPSSVFSADFNGDGYNDLATANWDSDNVSILLGNGDGTFQSAVNYAVGYGSNSVFSADFDGDGNNDLATANYYSDNVSILLGNGDGTFQSAVNYAVGDGPYSVFSADFNGDGYNDLATANDSSDNVSILLGNGDGTFQSAVNYAVGDGPESVFSTDFDGDGNNDLATANFYSNNVSILLGNGDGTFQSAVNYAVGDTPHSVFSVDFNGDGNNDLATANSGNLGNPGDVSILLGNGDGTFQSAVNYAVGYSPRSVFSADFNGDGDNDLATANSEDWENPGDVSILLGNGDGTFQSAVNYAVGRWPNSVFSADFDGDGDNDLATANENSHNVSILLNQTHGTDAVDDSPTEQLPSGFELAQNYPNPFNPSTTIKYSVVTKSRVVIDIYNLLGQRVTTLVDKVQSANTYEIQWKGKDNHGKAVATGVYFYRVKMGDYTSSKKMLLIR
ncbi:MAG: FG-GAP-like repeat-containing protein [candidate division Zixibacteria bacterium]|nr:FG-GAP-like repeat-containing protein [candidate division Zixibacteria bacterium]